MSTERLTPHGLIAIFTQRCRFTIVGGQTHPHPTGLDEHFGLSYSLNLLHYNHYLSFGWGIIRGN